MKLFAICEGGLLKHRALIVFKRLYRVKGTQVKSQSELCRKCYKGIKKMLK